MNALYLAPDGTLLDPLGGLPDLLARRVRFVGDAATRIREDCLRVLRYFRFHAWYGDPEGGLDPDGLDASRRRRRPRHPLARAGRGRDAAAPRRAPTPPRRGRHGAAGVLGGVLPGATAGRWRRSSHAETRARRRPDPLRRLAALGGEDAARAPAAQPSRGAAARRCCAARRAASVELAWRHGPRGARDVALVRAAAGARAARGPRGAGSPAAPPRVPLRAADLPLRGRRWARPGGGRGAWIASDLRLRGRAFVGNRIGRPLRFSLLCRRRTAVFPAHIPSDGARPRRPPMFRFFEALVDPLRATRAADARRAGSGRSCASTRARSAASSC